MAEPNYLLKIAADFTCCLIVGIPILLFKFVATPFHRGFYCDDESIRHPYKGSTITNVALYIVGVFTPVITMSICEALRYRQRRVSAVSHIIRGRQIHPYVWEMYCLIGIFGFGCCTSQLTTDIAKYTIGRLRPHFLSVCKPDWSRLNCTDKIDQNIYVTDFQCLGDPETVREARLSFPSGHSSFSAFTMVFLVLYIQARMQWSIFKLLKPLLQFIAFMMATYTALSRVSDYKHHWSDVLAGSLQGTIVSLLIVFFVSDLFQTDPVVVRVDGSTEVSRTDMRLKSYNQGNAAQD